MSTAPTPRRHALGLPAGSIRAILALSVLGSLWVMALRAPDKLPPSFVYLLFLMLFILVHYIAAHARTQGTAVSRRHALGLPRGTIRLLLLVGFIGLLMFLWQNSAQLEVVQSDLLFQLIALLLAGFVVGYLLTGVFRSPDGHLPAWLQDVQAWLALLAAIAMVILVMIYSVINPSLAEQPKIPVDKIEAGLAALIGFYFGAGCSLSAVNVFIPGSVPDC
jgi:hypothetical protein